MKIICGERVLDLDRMNAVQPDGAHVWVEVLPFSYAANLLTAESAGTYVLTSDQGVVSLRDMAFKLLFDMGVWSGAKCCRYLARDIARGVHNRREGDWSTDLLPDSGTAGHLASILDLKGIHMPAPEAILECNLKAITNTACDLDEQLCGMLSEYLFVDGLSFAGLHDAVSMLLESFSSNELADFIEGVYGVVVSDPDEVRQRLAKSEPAVETAPEPESEPEAEPASGDEAEPASEPGPEDGPEPASGAGSEPGKLLDLNDEETLAKLSNSSAKTMRDIPWGPRQIPGGSGLFSSGRRLKGSDLTGVDETYTLEYYVGLYQDALDKADATGFADQLIRSRAGQGTAPIAIMDEAMTRLIAAVDKSNNAKSQGTALRSSLLEMAAAVAEAAGKLEALQEPEDRDAGKTPEEPAPQAPADQEPASQEPVSQEAASVEPASEPAGGSGIPAPDEDYDDIPPAGQASESEPEPEPDPEPESEPESEPEYDIPDWGDEDGSPDPFDEEGPPENELGGEPDEDL